VKEFFQIAKVAAGHGESLSHERLRYGPGFTLVELLVVIAIIAILSTLLLLSISRITAKAATTGCLNNLRQLQVCWHGYATDNQDVLPPNDSVNFNGNELVSGLSWCQGDARVDLTTDNLRNGVLFPYNRTTGIYHCPADRSMTDVGHHLRNRSYNMSQSINGIPEFDVFFSFTTIPSFKKLTEISRPGFSDLFVFIDEHPDTLYDARFSHPVDMPGYVMYDWEDMPADRHNQGAGLSFADGHVERWRWRAPMSFYGLFSQVTPEQLPDYFRLQGAMRNLSDY
jgi:prepilin-type N-terminal cleavage/methylation domain-containing protein/prepilin-type processing-associated H-X9-DG protein